MSEKPPVPAALQTLLLICETDQQREELTHCYYATLGGDPFRSAFRQGILSTEHL